MIQMLNSMLTDIQNQELFPVLVRPDGSEYANLELVQFNVGVVLWVDNDRMSLEWLEKMVKNGYTIEAHDEALAEPL